MPDIFISAPEEEKKKEEIARPQAPLPEFIPTQGNFLSAYLYKPRNVEFETRGPDEKVILFLRQHPAVNIHWIIIGILMAVAPVALKFFPILSFLPANFGFVVVLGWYLITMAFVLENFISWFYNIYIVTDERIIDIDFYNLVYKEVSDANIEKIQDVTYRVGGIVKSIFGYGDVLIQTAAEVADFDFPSVPNPEKVARILQELAMSTKETK